MKMPQFTAQTSRATFDPTCGYTLDGSHRLVDWSHVKNDVVKKCLKCGKSWERTPAEWRLMKAHFEVQKRRLGKKPL
jgi:hypothetical protein